MQGSSSSESAKRLTAARAEHPEIYFFVVAALIIRMDPANIVVTSISLYQAGFQFIAFCILVALVTVAVFLPLMHAFCQHRKLQLPQRDEKQRLVGFIVLPNRIFIELASSLFAVLAYGLVWGELIVVRLLQQRWQLQRFLASEDFSSLGALWLHVLCHLIMYHISWDFYYYWIHRWMHVHHAWFGGWKYHESHHRSKEPNFLTGYAFHALEPLLSVGIFQALYFIVFEVHPATVILVTAVGLFTTCNHHAGYYLFPNGWETNPYTNWFMSSLFHDVHHSTVHYNYGGFLSIWDRVFGTVHPRYEQIARTIEHRIWQYKKE